MSERADWKRCEGAGCDDTDWQCPWCGRAAGHVLCALSAPWDRCVPERSRTIFGVRADDDEGDR